MARLVVTGDTLYGIARRHGVSVAELVRWNQKPDATVRIGEVLRVQAP